MNTKQTPGNNILTKLITNTIHTLYGHKSKTIQRKPPTQHNRTEALALEQTQPSDINKAKQNIS